MSAWLTFKKPLSPENARKLMSKTPGLVLLRKGTIPRLSWWGKGPVFAGRVRRGATDKELCLWLSYDNLLKGAALNSVQIAEELLRRGWI